jgi:2-C-methyl-D-erythritol 4-phosphate cytidylyltransferase
VTASSVWAVVVAGGSGRRFGAEKQFVTLGGRALVAWSVAAARSVADGVVVVLPADNPGDAFGADVVVVGGDTRAASVRAGLAAVPGGAEVIVVHDGARPLASAELFGAVVDAVVAGADGAVPGLPVGDTLKRVSGDTVADTVSRDGLVMVQTPQAFRAAVLRRAHASGDDATDDAALVESLGATVRVVPGEPRNLKVTTTADLDVVRALVQT